MPGTDKWPLRKWVLFTNAMGAVGIVRLPLWDKAASRPPGIYRRARNCVLESDVLGGQTPHGRRTRRG